MTPKTFALLAAAGFLAVAAPAFAQGGGGGRGLRQMDTNGDGAITRAEAEASRTAMFTRLDTNRDGFINQAERDAARQAMEANRANGAGGPPPGGGGGGGPGGGMMAQADTNNDGRISRQEYMAQPYRMFDRLDTDRNGTISAAELEAGRQARGGN